MILMLKANKHPKLFAFEKRTNTQWEGERTHFVNVDTSVNTRANANRIFNQNRTAGSPLVKSSMSITIFTLRA